jgi:hypothetical protein
LLAANFNNFSVQSRMPHWYFLQPVDTHTFGPRSRSLIISFWSLGVYVQPRSGAEHTWHTHALQGWLCGGEHGVPP